MEEGESAAVEIDLEDRATQRMDRAAPLRHPVECRAVGPQIAHRDPTVVGIEGSGVGIGGPEGMQNSASGAIGVDLEELQLNRQPKTTPLAPALPLFMSEGPPCPPAPAAPPLIVFDAQ
jgi:hypothetical protein